jgi:hypothetical protein
MPAPIYQAPPIPNAVAPAAEHGIPAIAAAPPPVIQPPIIHPPMIQPSPPPIQPPPPSAPAAAWPRARPELRVQDQPTSPPAAPPQTSEPAPPFTSLAAHLARTGAARAGDERPGPAGIIAAPRVQAGAAPRGDHRSVAEMFRLLSAGRGDRAGQNSAFTRDRDGDSALFRRL